MPREFPGLRNPSVAEPDSRALRSKTPHRRGGSQTDQTAKVTVRQTEDKDHCYGCTCPGPGSGSPGQGSAAAATSGASGRSGPWRRPAGCRQGTEPCERPLRLPCTTRPTVGLGKSRLNECCRHNARIGGALSQTLWDRSEPQRKPPLQVRPA
jgi:hypothetical protein